MTTDDPTSTETPSRTLPDILLESTQRSLEAGGRQPNAISGGDDLGKPKAEGSDRQASAMGRRAVEA